MSPIHLRTHRAALARGVAPSPKPVFNTRSLGRTTVPMAASSESSDLAKLAEAATAKGKEYAAKAQEAIKSVDVDKIKQQVSGLSATNLRAALDSALALYGKYDGDGDGKLEIGEAVALLNSENVTAAVEKLTGQPHTQRTEADIKKWFNRADFDKSSTLSKREFAVLYTGLIVDKAKGGLQGFATAAISALDSDNDGIINSTELKALLASGPLAVVVNVIPDGKEVNYRELLSKLPGGAK
ncbi:hypothetical protein MNEG_10368 [Monoraphidium neglectum]|uniref:EF-hand domain-containing protein n=1 Tax=Monoraphidium neglectum TaxID=145388 RepID=A0A0D2M1T2_9CHLO|nr:hypothetical protein MNEG_10368 [Monoraphidium neglectum]KIY97594.1 hypothetical protein MNEG_10368 [Monoraphidium neglectum]|eukprot:XP_013896614.1 hypothetical protein MNEG_10368 [Monoraphidium neglectum]